MRTPDNADLRPLGRDRDERLFKEARRTLVNNCSCKRCECNSGRPESAFDRFGKHGG